MRILKIIGGILVGLIVLIGLMFLVARMGDGPMGLLPGGPLESGDLVLTPVNDWGFAESIETIEMQLVGDDISRTTWILVNDGKAYIPCSLGFPPGKDWYLRADEQGDAIVRVEGKRYPVRLVRTKDPQERAELVEIAVEKYTGGPPGEAEVWFFALEPRTS